MLVFTSGHGCCRLKLEEPGFEFEHPDITTALQAVLEWGTPWCATIARSRAGVAQSVERRTRNA